MISADTIRTIKDTVRIDEVVSDFISLKRRGASLIGRCPFHNEKTPSFHVNTAHNFFKCFGCGEAGDSISFVMKHEHYSYVEALRFLAKRYNIDIQETETTEEEKLNETERESMFALNEFALEYFINNMHNSDRGRAIGLSYFKERSFDNAIIEKFQLGFSPEDKEAFSKHAVNNGFNKEFLIKTGLSIETSAGNLMDRFYGRVIFPIHNISGRPIGFGGRILQADKHPAKYLNSPESIVFDKSNTLYGLFFAKKAISNKDECLLVEGYTDVISLAQAGVENVVASMGTSLTTEQIRKIARYTKNITILYDGDVAGVKASLRGMDMILEQGLTVKIVLFPDGEDPDSFAKSHKSEEVEEYIKNSAEDFIRYKSKLLKHDAGNDPIKRVELLHDIVSTIAIIPDQIMRTVYTKECSTILEFPEATLVNEVNKIIRSKNRRTVNNTEQEIVEHAIEEKPVEIVYTNTYCETEPIRLLLLYGNREIDINKIPLLVDNPTNDENICQLHQIVISIVDNAIEHDKYIFDDKNIEQLYSLYKEEIAKEKKPDLDFFIHDEKCQTTAINLIDNKIEISNKWKDKEGRQLRNETDDNGLHLTKVLSKWIHTFRLLLIEKYIEENKTKLRESPEDIELIAKHSLLEKERKRYAAALGTVVTK